MILYLGEIYDDVHQKKLIQSLKNDCYETLTKGNVITSMQVVQACDVLAKNVRNGNFDAIILPLLYELDIPKEQFIRYLSMFEKESLIQKIKTEL